MNDPAAAAPCADPGAVTSASVPRRVGALVYDGLLLIAVLFAAAGVVVSLNDSRAVAPSALWFRAYLLGVAFAYFGWFWTRAGFTPGMRPWRLKLCRADGGSPGWADAARRFAAAVLSLLCAGCGFWWALVDREGLTWHDRLSATRVVLDRE